jgi:hypothetical protein
MMNGAETGILRAQSLVTDVEMSFVSVQFETAFPSIHRSSLPSALAWPQRVPRDRLARSVDGLARVYLVVVEFALTWRVQRSRPLFV